MNMHIFLHLSRSVLILLVTLGLACAADPPRLQQIKHTTLSDSSEQVALRLNGSYSPKVFTLKGESPRVVFDFEGMIQGREIGNTITVNGPIVKTIRVGMHKDPAPKTRVVFDLKTLKGVNFTQQFSDPTSTLTIRFTTTKKAAPPAKEAQRRQPEQPPSTAAAEKHTATEKMTRKEDEPPPPSMEVEKQRAPTQPVSPPPEIQAPTSAVTPTAPPAPPERTTPKEDIAPQPPDQPEQEKTASATPEKKTETGREPDPGTPRQKEVSKGEGAATAQEPILPATTDAQSVKAPASQPEPQPPVAAKPTETAKPVSAEPVLESIKFDPSSAKGEMVLFKLNGFHPPAVHGVEEGIPRVICDFNNTTMTGETKRLIKTDGKYVKAIRTSKTKKPEKVRVVIDLEPNRSYDLQQVFFKDDNLFVIIVNTIKK